METQSTIRAFQSIFPRHKFDQPMSFSEKFAQARFSKKMEIPSSSTALLRKEKCWVDFINFDDELPDRKLVHHKWARARLLLHKALEGFEMGDVEFPKGSSFDPTRGYNSVEAYLTSNRWTVSRDCFSLFAETCYNHHGLKKAFRERYSRWFSKKNFSESRRHSEHILWNGFSMIKDKGRRSFAVFCWKLEQIIHFNEFSRFRSIPKNNEKDRPINIENFGNLVVQRRIGNGLRACLKNNLGVDLDNLAEEHGRRISNLADATIDLKNASDSNLLWLCEYLLPKRIFSLCLKSRAPFLLGPDGVAYSMKKISSMGNGFTFELMTMILLSVSRCFDSRSSVFGDDIIINKLVALDFIKCIEDVGYVVNKEKSFIDGSFRESCGSNYHEEEGYIKSYDFKYPTHIHDCITLFNKVTVLARVYPSFLNLRNKLKRHVPKSLRGFSDVHLQKESEQKRTTDPLSDDISSYFMYYDVEDSCQGVEVSIRILRYLRDYLQKEKITGFYGFKFVPEQRSKTYVHLNSSHWAKYLSYLSAGRRSNDIRTGYGRWVSVLYVTCDGVTMRAPSIKQLMAE